METRNKIACIFNYAPHYREAIYHLMAQELHCDFFFGANHLPSGEQLKKMNFVSLPGFKKESRVFKLRYVWQCNVVWQAFKGYQIYILTGSPTLSNIVFMFFAKILKKKVFLWTHGLKTLEEGKHPLLRLFFQSATGYFLYGNFGKAKMLKYGVPESRLFVINNSLDYDRQLEVRKKLVSSDVFKNRFKNDDPVIVFAGRLLKYKKMEMVLDAQKILSSECPFNLVLVGDGPEETQLKYKADEMGLTDRVWFYGACYDEKKLGSLFYNATLTVSPGNVGLTAIHSMMYGTPILSHNKIEHQMPECEAIRQGETGLLFEEDDVADLASKIKGWFSNSASRGIIRQKCFSVIDDYYNPYYSVKVMKQAINGL